MMKKFFVRCIAILLVVSLTGCGVKTVTPTEEEDSMASSLQEEALITTIPTEDSTEEKPSSASSEVENVQQTAEATVEPIPETTPTPPILIPEEEIKDEYGMTEQQRNSFSMLYYLAITAEEIRISKDNRLILDDIYTSLLNDINPGSIDETTQDHLKNLRDIIKSYINISVKRERLQYIYNQDKAATIRNAVPNPLAILSVTNSFDWKKLVLSVAYTAVDSYNNYKSSNEAVDQEFFMSGWELDDEETATIQKNRERAFDYMVDIVQEYDLDGKLTLNEKAIETFAEICAIESVQQKIRRLEAEEETYKLLGNYWLELADCYYETSKYDKCLACIDKYNELATGIYRKDYNYVQILPKAIVAAQETYQDEEYVEYVGGYAQDIMDNTTTEEWAIRYFVAQVYLDLYARTDNSDYLKDAYNIAYDNVAILLDEQVALNTTYLEEVKEITVEEPDYRFMTETEKKEAQQEYKEEQKRVKAYNKALKETRETELPLLYEPLILNCELLFALADEIDISDSEKTEIEDILRTDYNGVFLSKVTNSRYSFGSSKEEYGIDFSKDEIAIPVYLLNEGTQIVITVKDGGETTTIDDCTVTEVVRKEKEFDSFIAYVSSEALKDYAWTSNTKVSVSIYNGDNYDPNIFNFKVKEYKNNWLIADKVVFEEE